MKSHVLLLTLCVSAVACGGSPAAPQPQPQPAPSLTFSITPNPVPYAGILPGCAGNPGLSKTWLYTLRISNVGNAAFEVSSFSSRVTSPLLATPVDTPYNATTFGQAFGATTIQTQGSLSGSLCVFGPYDSATLVWTFVGASGGGTFSTPSITFQPSGVPN